MRNYGVIDCETTGLYPEQGHEIVQISIKGVNGSTLEYHPAGQLTVLLKPQHPEKADPGALKVIGAELWERANKEGLDPKVALKKILEYFEKINDKKNKYEKPWFTGHNAPFDHRFIMHYALEYGLIKDQDNTPFHYNLIDTMTLFFGLFESDPSVKNYRLDSLLEVMGMARAGTTHGAEEDVDLTAKALVRLIKFFRRCRSAIKSKE